MCVTQFELLRTERNKKSMMTTGRKASMSFIFASMLLIVSECIILPALNVPRFVLVEVTTIVTLLLTSFRNVVLTMLNAS